MRERLIQLLGLVFTAWQAMVPLYIAWILWRPQLLEAIRTLRGTTFDMVMRAAIACTVVAVVIHLFEKRYEWAGHNAYRTLAQRLKEGRAKRVMGALGDGIGNIAPRSFFHIGSYSNHWLVVKVEQWIERVFGLLFWPMTIVAFAHAVYDGGRSVLGAVLLSALALLILALFGMKVRNLAAGSLLMLWLGVVFYAYGAEQSAVQAVLAGMGLTAWGLWERWREKIREEPQVPPQAAPETDTQ